MTDDQVAEMKAAKEKLMESAQKVFAKMYEQRSGSSGQPLVQRPDMGAGAAGGAAAGSADDDVVDADYKEV